ncbi:MAG: hypothetical protein ACTSXD_02125 [Candidatus Heimdallarchaeaceae archaeon]
MSCVVGIKYKDKIYMGADSCVTKGGDRVLTLTDPKIFRRKQFLIGFCGELRVGQFLKHTNIPKDIDTVDKLVEFMKTIFENEGFIRKGKDFDEPTLSVEAEFIVAYHGRIYIIGADLSVIEDGKNDYCAIGSGADFALGSLYTTKNQKVNPRKRLIRALKSSAYFDPGVSSPFRVYSITK